MAINRKSLIWEGMQELTIKDIEGFFTKAWAAGYSSDARFSCGFGIEPGTYTVEISEEVNV